MSRIKHLHLVLPQALGLLRSNSAMAPTLLNWLQQAERYRLWTPDDLQHAHLDPWQHALLHSLPASLRAHGLASGALQWRGEGGTWPTGSCLHAEWVHLQAGMDDLRLQLPTPPSVDEQAQLLASVQPLLSLAGFDLQASSGASPSLYLMTTRSLRLSCYSPRAGFATRVYDILPQGEHGPELRRLMTEVQMLLHEHPVNNLRTQRGLPTLNALWLWGAAPVDLVTERCQQRLLSNHPYVQGLAEHLHLPCWPVPADVSALLSVEAAQTLLVLPPAVQQEAVGSPWLAELDAALTRADIEQLDVYLDHWRLRLYGGRLSHWRRKFDKRRDLNELLA